MFDMYNWILNAILKKYPDHEEKIGLLPEEYPEHYECRYVLNGYFPKAFHLANDGENRLLLSIFPAATSGNYTHYTTIFSIIMEFHLYHTMRKFS